MLSLRVALASGELIDTVAVPRHAVGPDLTQLFVGSRGHARDHHARDARDRAAAGRAPLHHAAASRTSRPASRPSGATLAAGHRPSVIRMYDEEATARTLSPVVGEPLDGVCAVVCCEGEPAAVSVEGSRTSSSRARRARASSTRARRALVGPPLRVLQAAAPPRAARDLGHDRRRRDLRADRRRARRRSKTRGARRLRRPRSAAADALLALVPLGHDDLRPLPDPGRRSPTRSRCTTGSGRTASPPCSRPAA